MKLIRVSAVVLFTLVGFVGTSFAQGPSQSQDQDTHIASACKSDISQFCKDITPGQGRVGACLKAHDDKLSASCKEEWVSVREKFQENMRIAKTACSVDMRRFCPDAMGAHDVMSCLNSHASDLSPSCKSYQTSMAEKAKHRATS